MAAGLFLLALAGTAWLVLEQRSRSIEERLRELDPLIERHSAANALPKGLVRSVIRHESGGDPLAVSSAGAVGAMQITPITQREVIRQRHYPPGDLYNPAYNIQIGTAYLRILLDRFNEDRYLAVAAYNMGPTRLDTLRTEHPDLTSQQLVEQYAPAETVEYCRRVLDWE